MEMRNYSLVDLNLHCQNKLWKKWVPSDLGESPRFDKSDSPRSGGIPESSVSSDCYYSNITNLTNLA